MWILGVEENEVGKEKEKEEGKGKEGEGGGRGSSSVRFSLPWLGAGRLP